MNKKEEIIGKVFGKWMVISLVENDNRRCVCRCQCGLEKPVIIQTLSSGESTMCKKCSNKSRNNDKKTLSVTFFNRGIKNSVVKNIEFAVSIEYCQKLMELQNFKCALSGLEIYWSTSSMGCCHGEATASLDRIDSSKGYIEGNVQWVHKDVNRMKWALNQDYFIQLCNLIINNNINMSNIKIENKYGYRDVNKQKTKISNVQVLEIKEKSKNGAKAKDLAIEYNCTPGNISYIINNLSRRDSC